MWMIGRSAVQTTVSQKQVIQDWLVYTKAQSRHQKSAFYTYKFVDDNIGIKRKTVTKDLCARHSWPHSEPEVVSSVYMYP